MKMNSVYSKSGYAEGKYEMDIKWAFNALQIRSLDFKHCSWIGSQENAWNRLSKNSPFSHKSRVLNVYSLICIRMTHENWKSHCWLSGQKPLSQLLFCQVRHLYLWIFKNGTPLRCCDSSVTLCLMLVGMVGLNKD